MRITSPYQTLQTLGILLENELSTSVYCWWQSSLSCRVFSQSQHRQQDYYCVALQSTFCSTIHFGTGPIIVWGAWAKTPFSTVASRTVILSSTAIATCLASMRLCFMELTLSSMAIPIETFPAGANPINALSTLCSSLPFMIKFDTMGKIMRTFGITP